MLISLDQGGDLLIYRTVICFYLIFPCPLSLREPWVSAGCRKLNISPQNFSEDIFRAFGLPGAAKLHAEDLDYDDTVKKLTVTFEQSFAETLHGLDGETN